MSLEDTLIGSKRGFWGLMNIVLIIAILFGVKFLFSGDLTFDANRTITVSAEGKTTIIPDIGRITFSVVSEGKDPKQLQETNAKKVDASLSYIKSMGVEAKDIKTSGYQLYPRYNYDVKPLGTSQPYILGYTLTQTVEVKVRDLTKLGDILGGLPAKGVNQVDHVGFDVDDEEAGLASARAEAFTKAKAKAEAMASYAGARLGNVVTFSEGYGGGYPIFYKGLEAADGRYGMGGATPTSAPTPIEAGSQDIVVNVSVTYSIR